MKTKRWNVTEDESHLNIAIKEAIELLDKGCTVAFPTETVYGLGADATNESAVSKIFIAKGRPQDNPLIAHVATKEQLLSLVGDVPAYARELINEFSPGPITFVLPSNGVCAPNVTAGLDTVAVRIPNHPVALRLIALYNRPIAAPSANISGKPSPTTADHVWEDLQGKIGGLIDAGPTGVGMESTVVDCTGVVPEILRPGGITEEQIRSIVGTVKTMSDHHDEQVKSPGTKYKHYTPDVPLWVVDGTVDDIQKVINEEQEKSRRVAIVGSTSFIEQLSADETLSLGDDLKEIAAHLYDGLRHFTCHEVDVLICEAFPEAGIGKALMNRLKKAASKVVIRE